VTDKDLAAIKELIDSGEGVFVCKDPDTGKYLAIDEVSGEKCYQATFEEAICQLAHSVTDGVVRAVIA
jgi:hypothetical protein